MHLLERRTSPAFVVVEVFCVRCVCIATDSFAFTLIFTISEVPPQTEESLTVTRSHQPCYRPGGTEHRGSSADAFHLARCRGHGVLIDTKLWLSMRHLAIGHFCKNSDLGAGPPRPCIQVNRARMQGSNACIH